MRDRTSLALLERYHDALSLLAHRAARYVTRTLNVEQETLAEGLRDFVEEALPLWTSAQEQAVDISAGFFELYGSNETDRLVEAGERLGANETRNGVSLEDSLVGIPANVYTKIKEGKPFERAVRYGRESAFRLVQTEVMDIASRELTNQMDASPLCNGWRWKSRGTCGACTAMDSGERLPAGTPLNRHPFCVCIAEPSFRGAPDRVRRETGRERFERLPIMLQNEMFGEEKAELVRTGAITWEALVHVQRDGFEPKITEAPLEALT